MTVKRKTSQDGFSDIAAGKRKDERDRERHRDTQGEGRESFHQGEKRHPVLLQP